MNAFRCTDRIGILVGCLCLLTIVGAAHASRLSNRHRLGTGYGLNTQEKAFANQAIQDSFARVMLGKLALSKSATTSVKEFAQKVVDEQIRGGDELKKLVINKGVVIYENMDAKRSANYARISSLTGLAFEAAFQKALIDDHKKAVTDLQAMFKQVSDPDLKSWISTNLPILQKRLALAASLAPGKPATVEARNNKS